MEHQARFASLHSTGAWKYPPRKDKRPPHGAGIIYVAIAGAAAWGAIILFITMAV